MDEPDAEPLEAKLRSGVPIVSSAVAIWETVRAVARETEQPIEIIRADLRGLFDDLAVEVMPIDDDVADAAVAAHARFGKGVHPARLNMGDCFAYACARVRGLPLLYKGEDFAATDVVRA